ncbi:MAG: MotA/TolQ/ExbB proton channel family protein [Chthoniobacterales bacterium]
MKKLLIASLSSLALVALTSFAQQPPPPPPPAAAPAAGTQPTAAGPAGMTNPAAANPAPGTNVPPTGPAGAPGSTPTMSGVQPNTTGVMSPAPGVSPATGVPATSTGASPATAAGSTAATGSPGASPAAATTAKAPEPTGWKNFLIDNFKKGGPIMWPILIVSIIAVAVVLERVFWWLGRWMRRDPKRIEKVFTAIENGDVAEASRLSRGSRDPVLRMMFNGLNHQHASLQGALQVAAGIEIKRAGRFLVVMDTLVTLAPLLGLLGTITGLIRSFSFLGNEELAVQAVTGGIAEALIATACGLGIAIFSLIPFNFFTSRVSNLEFELQTAATNLEVMLEAQSAGRRGDVEITRETPTSATRSSI